MSPKLSKTNNVLLILIIAVNAYILASPFLPQAVFWVTSHDHKEVTKLQQQVHDPAPKQHQPNRLTVPAMLLNEPIYDGTDTYAELNKGIWRWPSGGTPDKVGNTILIGHRFTYTTPRGVFYLLDKVKIGDEIGLVWNDKKYIYKVNETKVVSPTQTNILAPTTKPTLTLYTCTPLWWPKQRLVVTASLEQTL